MTPAEYVDKSVHLTPTEGRLPSCLVHNAERIVTHRELLKAMASVNRNMDIGDLRQYIARLRKKKR